MSDEFRNGLLLIVRFSLWVIAMYKLVFYVPESHLEEVKEAVFSAGAGRLGNYEACAWQVLGLGQFRPLPGSNPYIGQHYALEQVKEWRVEMICENGVIHEVVATLKASHPYEEVAYEVWKLAEI